MMAAMMLPSALPMIRLHRLGADDAAGPWRREARSALFVVGYLLVWAASGVVVWVAGRLAAAVVPMEARSVAVAAVLLAAGVYQLTPLKATCLRACRTPMDFLLTHWYRGAAGTLRLGVEHGLYCLGCCWALMAVFVVAGSMSLVWAVAIAAVVAVEKLAPRGPLLGRLLGVGLLAAAAAVLFRPELAGTMGH